MGYYFIHVGSPSVIKIYCKYCFSVVTVGLKYILAEIGFVDCVIFCKKFTKEWKSNAVPL